MKHPQTFVMIMIGVIVTFGVLIWSGSLWGALGALIAGFALAFVMSMAWLWSPKSGVAKGRRPTHDSFAGLK